MRVLRSWIGGFLVVAGFLLVVAGIAVTNGLDSARSLFRGYLRGRSLDEGDKRMMRQRLMDLTEML